MQNNVVFLTFSLLVIILAGTSCKHNKPKETVHEPVKPAAWISSEARSCSSNSDCVLFKADCCGCRQGGKQVGINKKYLSKVRSEAAYHCAERMCMQLISKHASCKAREAICEYGTCVPQM